MKSVALLLLTTFLAALMVENTSATADAIVTEEKAVPLEPLYPDGWYNGEGEEDERDLRLARLAAPVSEEEGGLVPKTTRLGGKEDVQLMELSAEDTTVELRAARLRLDDTETASKNQLGVPLP